MTQPGRWRLPARTALAGLFGALAAFGLAPYGMWPLTVIVLALVPWLLRDITSARQSAWIGWALATGYFGHALIWIVEPFLVDVQRHGWMAPFALVFLSGGLALFWAAAFWVAQCVSQGAAGRAWAMIVTISLAEFARAYVLTGFPWAGLGQIWVGTDTASLLAWIGPQGLSVLTLLVAIPPGLVLVRSGPFVQRLAGFAPAIVVGLASLGLSAPLSKNHPVTGTVRLVQPNAPQHQKWDPDMMPVFFNRLIDYTAQAPHPDLVVWPETAVPTLLEYAGPAFERIAGAAAGSPLAVGIQRSDGARSYNSLVHLDSTGAIAAMYDKHHLVPFGEYIPAGDLLAGFGLRGFAAQDGDGYSAGPGPQVMAFGKLGLAVPLICYEAVFPQDVAGTPVRGDFLLQITNDAWFGRYAGPYQHLAQAQMRAIEQGLPMVRAANTGISAMIDPKGRITGSLPLGRAGYIDVGLPAPLAPTFYSRTGDLPVLVLLVAVAMLLWRTHRNKIKPT